VAVVLLLALASPAISVRPRPFALFLGCFRWGQVYVHNLENLANENGLQASLPALMDTVSSFVSRGWVGWVADGLTGVHTTTNTTVAAAARTTSSSSNNNNAPSTCSPRTLSVVGAGC
jgi:hypothetical protein